MAQLNANQQAVVNFLNNSTESFSATQIGVAVGKKNPKNASTWSKPILEELVKLGAISQEVSGSKTTFSKLEKEIYPATSDEEVMKMNQEEHSTPHTVLTDEDIAEAKDVEDYAKQLIFIINKEEDFSSKLIISGGIVDKKVYNEKLTNAIDDAIEVYENESGQIPTNFYNEVIKIVKKELKFKIPKKQHEPRINIFTGVDRAEVMQFAKDAIEANEKLEEGNEDKQPVVAVVRKAILSYLEEEYGFNETSLEDKRTRAFIYRIKQELGISQRPETIVMATDTVFEKGQEVTFTAHRLTGRKGEVLEGTVVRTFLNDFGFRYVVIKSDNKSYTKRDKDVSIK